MLLSPVSPESPDRKHGASAFSRIHNFEAGLEVAENQNREKNDLNPVVVANSPVDANSPLYISHGRWPEAPQPIDSTAPQAMGGEAPESSRATTAPRSEDPSAAEKASTLAASEKEEKRRWCGLSGGVFLLIIILIILLIAAIIGGAVGGVQARKNRPAPSATEGGSKPTQAGDGAPSNAGASPSASATMGPHVRFSLQTYDDYNYAGSVQAFTEPGIWKPAFPILSYKWVPARSGDFPNTTLLRCSVAFCKNQTTVGWRGASHKEQPGSPGDNHDVNFLHIACDDLNVNPECSGLGLDTPAASTWAQTGQVFSLPAPTPTDGDGSATSSSGSAEVTTPPSPKSGSSSISGSTSGPGSGSGSSTSGSGSGPLPTSATATKTSA